MSPSDERFLVSGRRTPDRQSSVLTGLGMTLSALAALGFAAWLIFSIGQATRGLAATVTAADDPHAPPAAGVPSILLETVGFLVCMGLLVLAWRARRRHKAVYAVNLEIDSSGIFVRTAKTAACVPWDEIANLQVLSAATDRRVLCVEARPFLSEMRNQEVLGQSVATLGILSPARELMQLTDQSVPEAELVAAISRYSNGRLPRTV